MRRENLEKSYWGFLTDGCLRGIRKSFLRSEENYPAYYVYDIDRDQFLFVGSEIESIIGYTPEDIRIMGMRGFADRIDEADLSKLNNESELSSNSHGMVRKISYSFKGKTGDFVKVSEERSIVRSSDNSITAIISCLSKK